MMANISWHKQTVRKVDERRGVEGEEKKEKRKRLKRAEQTWQTLWACLQLW